MMFTDKAPRFPVINGLTCGARRQITSLGIGGKGGVTNHRLRSITDTIQNTIWEIQLKESETNSCALKNLLKSDSEKSEKPIHNTKYQIQSKKKKKKIRL